MDATPSLWRSYEPGSETVTFHASDFANINAATAGEVAAAINEDATLFEASVVNYDGRSYVKIKSKQGECAGRLRVIGGVANDAFGFDTILHHADGWQSMFSGATVLTE